MTLEAETRSPVEEAAAALGRAGIHTEPKKSTQGEQAAAEGTDPKPQTRKEWSASDQQIARHMLERYKAPNSTAKDLSDADIEFGLQLSSMQAGMDAKTKRLEAEHEALKAKLEETSKASDRKSDSARKADELAEAQELLTKAFDEGDSKQIGPALEKLKAAFAQSKDAAPVNTGGSSSAEVEDMLVETARTQLEQDWPALRNGGIFDEVRDLADGLKGRERYANMRSAEARISRLRDAATLVLGASDSKPSQTRPPGSSAPRPGSPDPADKAPQEPLSIARSILAKRGLK